MFVLSTKQTIGILLFTLVAIMLFFSKGISFGTEGLHILAICLAALLPAAFYHISKFEYLDTAPVSLIVSLLVGLLWFYIIRSIYPASEIVFGGVIACGTYLMLRMK